MRIDPQSVHAPEIGPVWLNSPPLTLRQLRGRLVLLDFWDFTCVNCLRTLPYVTAWHRRYEPYGVQVLGIHSPEFYFSKAPGVVEAALRELGIDYPVMLDNDYTVWKLFANRYWPTKYLIDGEGYLRYAHFGEGAYTETEQAIQELLREQTPGLTLPSPLPLVRPLDAPGALAFCPQPSPEIYLGHHAAALPILKASAKANSIATASAPAPNPISRSWADSGTRCPTASLSARATPPTPLASACPTRRPR